MAFNNFISRGDPSLLTVPIPPGLGADEEGLTSSLGEIGFGGPPLGADAAPGGVAARFSLPSVARAAM